MVYLIHPVQFCLQLNRELVLLVTFGTAERHFSHGQLGELPCDTPYNQAGGLGCDLEHGLLQYII